MTRLRRLEKIEFGPIHANVALSNTAATRRKLTVHSLIHLATACIMLLHALLGCCVHHDHCCAAENTESIASAADHASHDHAGLTALCSHGHAHIPSAHAEDGREELSQPPARGHQPPAHEGPHSCAGGDCVFVSSGQSVPAVDVESHWLGSLRLMESEEAGSVKEFAGSEPAIHSPPLSERFQSQYCIWLI